ncbi:hypothetical protein EVJ58_g4702 [Rhodofomes roseus]|uniref:Small secreted protein n=1 Tax=Rhodofomes roseus TaxID=34475 RepID=A0A4Y9YF25_9APHY|nr:hypothetical protein EVJ58_g4702 [Rhodofomes roseus]
MLPNLGVFTVLFSSFATLCAASNAFFATAIVTDAKNNSALECWQLNASVSVSSGAGTAGATSIQLGDLANATYTVLPPNFYGGVHNAPYPQWVVFTSGLAVVTLPNNPGTAYVPGGPNGVIIAVDTTGSGHNTSYPSNGETVALQIPFADGAVPPHTVVSEGPCVGNQIQNVSATE